MDHFYSGNAVSSVTSRGRVRVPRFLRATIERRSGLNEVILGSHDNDPCIVGYDVAYRRSLYADFERRRLIEERSGMSSRPHDARLRRVFGTAEQVSYDAAGGLGLPLFLRRKARIGGSALFIGTGGTFEIWDPEVAIECGDDDLKDLTLQMLRGAESQAA